MNKNSESKKLNLEYSELPDKQKDWDLSRAFVPGDGPLDAEVMFIGQAPGRNEDIERKPFIGTSGKFLTTLMNKAGLDRKDVYICSVVQFFPPKNRIPTDKEIELCKKFLFKQIEIINPKVIVVLGAVSCKTVLGMEGISKLSGTSVKRDGRTYLISMHPAAAVRIRTKMPIMEKQFLGFKSIIAKSLQS